MNMYQFILNMWVFGNIETEEKVLSYAAKGFITEAQAQQIIATPKN